MTIEEAVEHCYEKATGDDSGICQECKKDHIQLADWLKELIALRMFFRANNMEPVFDSAGSVKGVTTVETNVFTEEETIPNCTVQILRNPVTGEESVGWWRNDE